MHFKFSLYIYLYPLETLHNLPEHGITYMILAFFNYDLIILDLRHLLWQSNISGIVLCLIVVEGPVRSL